MARLLVASVIVLLAGCCTPADPMGPQVVNPGSDGKPFSPDNYVLGREAIVPGMPGILLQGEVFTDGQFHVLRVNATNAGGPTYLVPHGRCEPTWADTMATNGTPFRPRGYGAWLQCCAWKDFAHGDALVSSFQWDELIWGEGNRHGEAPPGTYTWVAEIPVLKVGEEPCVDTPALGRLEFEFTVP